MIPNECRAVYRERNDMRADNGAHAQMHGLSSGRNGCSLDGWMLFPVYVRYDAKNLNYEESLCRPVVYLVTYSIIGMPSPIN